MTGSGHSLCKASAIEVFPELDVPFKNKIGEGRMSAADEAWRDRQSRSQEREIFKK